VCSKAFNCFRPFWGSLLNIMVLELCNTVGLRKTGSGKRNIDLRVLWRDMIDGHVHRTGIYPRMLWSLYLVMGFGDVVWRLLLPNPFTIVVTSSVARLRLPETAHFPPFNP